MAETDAIAGIDNPDEIALDLSPYRSAEHTARPDLHQSRRAATSISAKQRWTIRKPILRMTGDRPTNDRQVLLAAEAANAIHPNRVGITSGLSPLCANA
jgi:hypothetical protein